MDGEVGRRTVTTRAGGKDVGPACRLPENSDFVFRLRVCLRAVREGDVWCNETKIFFDFRNSREF